MSDTISQLAAERDKAIEDMHDVVVSVDTLNWKIEHPSSRISLTQSERTEVDVTLGSSGGYRGAHARFLSPLHIRAQQQQQERARSSRKRREEPKPQPHRRLDLDTSPTFRGWQ